ncbi:MAG: tripartite tricarboxylate transporter substrate-binding protein [Anaerolineae bacterium]|nr:tripartite tricarboxylate transporter substrate-binding protein [Anaerolineae bacterium]
MKIHKPILITAATAALVLAACATPAPQAAKYPSKALTILAPANPGGGWDQTSRLMQKVLSEDKLVSVPVEVVNKGGAAGTIGLAEFVTKNKGDTHTIMTMGGVMVGGIHLNKSPVTLKETVPLARLTSEYLVVAVPANSKFQTLKDLLEAYKADPKSVVWGGGSAGGTDHVLVGLLSKAVGVGGDKINYVGYAGGGEAVAAVIGGQVTAGVSGFTEWNEQVKAGKMRFLAVSGEKKIAGDNTPTIKEAGYDVTISNWRGVVAAPGTDAATQKAIIDLLTKMRETKTWKETLEKNKWDDVFLPGDAYGKFLESEDKTFKDTLTAIGVLK